MFLKYARIFVAIMVPTFCSLNVGSSRQQNPGESEKRAATKVLHSYVEMRLRDADWGEYSRLITWPDEPSWDCHWVTLNYHVGSASAAGNKVIVPVTYERLGAFCGDFDLKPDRKMVTINYELVQRGLGWRIDGPIPDYPDLGFKELRRKLRTAAESTTETADRRSKFEAAARELDKAQATPPTK
jgi:hypothetical protein